MVAVREPRLTFPKREERRAVPKGVLGHFVRGDQFHSAAQFALALAEYDAALYIWRDSAYLLNNRADALYHLGRYEEAIRAFEGAIALRPDLTEAHVGRGVALIALNRHQEALQALEKAIEVRPDYLDAHVNRSLALRRMGRLEDADAAINEGLALAHDADLVALLNELQEEKLRRLRRRGIVSWSGGKPAGARPRVRVSDGPPLSDYIVESRR
jgi:tetratricopeptide (TPR) repeat protein